MALDYLIAKCKNCRSWPECFLVLVFSSILLNVVPVSCFYAEYELDARHQLKLVS